MSAFSEFSEDVKKSFLRQATNLMTYMNGYSITLRENISEEDFAKLYDVLADVTDKYNNYDRISVRKTM